ncbi:MAG TPA: cyclic nucleotide-binding domain-containing protein [Candidatus Saccharimonadales bacterium]|nr:cyclic nucleotide-binding domain-containing protein [Candidatus Saccharimonadales bacterium]
MTLTRDRRTELLAAAPLFAGVAAADLERLAGRTVEVEFPAGRAIARQGEVGTGFFVIATGAAQVIRDGEVIAHLGPGDFFGELSVLDGQPRTAQVVATEPTVCLGLASWEFEAAIGEEPSVALAVLRGLAGRLRGLTEGTHH